MPPTRSAIDLRDKPKVALTCQQCQQRKRKCDKSYPCQACIQAGIDCTPVTRARLPRGRHVPNKASELQQRVARLESLLSTQTSNVNSAASGKITIMSDPDTRSAFASISDEVVGIRDLLAAAMHDDVDDEEDGTESDVVSNEVSFDVMLFGDRSCFVQPVILDQPPSSVLSILLEVYLQRVDPILKVVHASSLRTAFSGTTPHTTSDEVLRVCVSFAAVNTLQAEECYDYFQTSQTILSDRFEVAAQVTLSRAGLMMTPNLPTLQAFVIYLIGLRARGGASSSPALLATAVRLAQQLKLGSEVSCQSLYEREIRRRLWYSLCILEVQSAFDSDTYSVLVGGFQLRTPPLHINDTDLLPNAKHDPRSREGFTDMTLPCITYELLRHLRKMIYVPLDIDGNPLRTRNWTEIHTIVDDFATIINQKYLRHCSPINTFQSYVKTAGEGMITVLSLLARRPLYRTYSREPPPSKDNFQVLTVAVEELEIYMRKVTNTDYHLWRWFAWSKWYSLAVILVELCACTQGPLVERAWKVAEQAFDYYKTRPHDPGLWRSTEKLMLKARNIKKRAFAANGAKHSGPAVGEAHDVSITSGQTGSASARQSSVKSNTTLTDATSNEDQDMFSAWTNWEAFVEDVNIGNQNSVGNEWTIEPMNGIIFYP